MKKMTTCFYLCFICLFLQAQIEVSIVGQLPEPVANNAVCEGFVNGVPYLFSFGGIDSTKNQAGIHLKSFRYNIATNQREPIPNLPDNSGKIAAAASRIGNIIYISGGYHVALNGSETSSAKMHRYDINNNIFLSDGADIPIATDDHVQAVWRDSLIYLITGWSNTSNIPNVQIYDPENDLWTVGTSTPNNHQYKSFGASGSIIGDTIYYFGGAASSAGFNIQNQLRKGIINPNDPTDIIWSISTLDANTVGYRMASTTVNNEIHWIGGSENTYNYDGIAYDGSGGVSPTNRDLFLSQGNTSWEDTIVLELPIDLRGIARIYDTVQYVAGGMLDGQAVTANVYKLEWNKTLTTNIQEETQFSNITIGPNPFSDFLTIKAEESIELSIHNLLGKQILQKTIANEYTLSTEQLESGIYLLTLKKGVFSKTYKLIKK